MNVTDLQSTNELTFKHYSDLLEIESFSNADIQLAYRIACGEPNTLYVVSFETNMNRIENTDRFSLSINTSKEFDPNGEETLSVPIKMNNDTMKVKRIVKLDNSGESLFYLNMKALKGKISLTSPKITLLSDDSDFVVFSSKENDIEMVFFYDDVADMKSIDIQDLTNDLSILRKSIKEFVGYIEPYNGITQFIFTENIAYTALAGNPIYVNRAELAEVFFDNKNHDVVKKENTLAILCHEMSHTFDFIDQHNTNVNYLFDKEFFAILKLLFAFYINGYPIDYDFLSNDPPLNSRIFNHECFLRHLAEDLSLLEKPDNWEYIQNVLHKMRSINSEYSKYEMLNAFIEALINECGINIYQNFNEIEWETVLNHYRIN
jgi:hypothetical protein